MTTTGPEPRIFIAYRRDDSQGFARSIHDRLAQHFGPDAVFRDINDIEPGRPWEEAIDEALASCDVFVLLIGRGWLEATDDEGKRRIEDPEDRHRREIETAINRHIRMFVALMEDAHMPRKKQLPQPPPGDESQGVQTVAALHALRIADHAFDYGIEELVANIERASQQARESEEEREREAAETRQRETEAHAEAEELERTREMHRAAGLRPPEEEDREPEQQGEAWPSGRLLRFAGIGLGLVAVIVLAFVIFSGGDEEGAAVDGAPIDVGRKPVDLVFADGELWVTNRLGASVSVVNPDEPTESRDVQVDGQPEGIGLDAGFVFVSDGAGNSVSQIDNGDEVVRKIPTGLEPGGIAVDEEAVWVANHGSNTVSRIEDPAAEPQSIPVGGEPFGVATGAGAVWVTNRADGTVSRIPSGAREADDDAIPVGANPKGIAVGDDAVWVANTDDGTVSRIDPEAVEADSETITVGTEPRGIVAAFGWVWVTNGISNSVSRIDPEEREVVQTIEVGQSPEGITAGSDSIWVANGEADTVTRISPP